MQHMGCPTTVSNGAGRSWRQEAIAAAVSDKDLGAGDTLAAAILRNRPENRQVHVYGCSRRRAVEALVREDSGRVRGLRVLVPEAYRCRVSGEGFPHLIFGWHAFDWEGEHVEMAVAPFVGTETLIFFSGSVRAAEGAAAFVQERTRRPESRCVEYAFGTWGDAPRMDEEIKKVSWEDIVLPEETLASIGASAMRFFEKKADYARMGFPWRRGLLLVGPPGTGKTMVMKAVAGSVTDARPEVPFLYVQGFDGREGDVRDIHNVFRRARELAPCILAFEDIDGLVDESNRSAFLNQLDGFEENDGLLVLASSNHPERIDEALLKRPSRFDRVFHLAPPALAQREEYLMKLFSGPLLSERFRSAGEREAAAARAAAASEGLTPAHLKEAVLSAALALAHGGEPQGETPEGFGESVMEQLTSLRAYLRSARLPGKLGGIESPREPFGFGA